MKIELEKITIRELVEGYQDRGDDGELYSGLQIQDKGFDL